MTLCQFHICTHPSLDYDCSLNLSVIGDGAIVSARDVCGFQTSIRFISCDLRVKIKFTNLAVQIGKRVKRGWFPEEK